MDIALVANVKNEFVLGRVKDTVQSDGELYDSEIRPKVSADLGKNRDQFVANLLSELGESPFLKALKVRRRVDRIQYPYFGRRFKRV
jgi:hypothetical protein